MISLLGWLLWVFFYSLSAPFVIWAGLLEYRSTRASWILAVLILYFLSFLIYVPCMSCDLAFWVIPTVKGWFNSNQQIVVLSGWDGDDENADDDKTLVKQEWSEADVEMSQGDGNDGGEGNDDGNGNDDGKGNDDGDASGNDKEPLWKRTQQITMSVIDFASRR